MGEKFWRERASDLGSNSQIFYRGFERAKWEMGVSYDYRVSTSSALK